MAFPKVVFWMSVGAGRRASFRVTAVGTVDTPAPGGHREVIIDYRFDGKPRHLHRGRPR